MVDKEIKEVKKLEVKEAKVVEVATSYAPAIQLEDGNVVDNLTLLVLIYNKLLKIEKNLA